MLICIYNNVFFLYFWINFSLIDCFNRSITLLAHLSRSRRKLFIFSSSTDTLSQFKPNVAQNILSEWSYSLLNSSEGSILKFVIQLRMLIQRDEILAKYQKPIDDILKFSFPESLDQ